MMLHQEDQFSRRDQTDHQSNRQDHQNYHQRKLNQKQQSQRSRCD